MLYLSFMMVRNGVVVARGGFVCSDDGIGMYLAYIVKKYSDIFHPVVLL